MIHFSTCLVSYERHWTLFSIEEYLAAHSHSMILHPASLNKWWDCWHVSPLCTVAASCQQSPPTLWSSQMALYCVAVRKSPSTNINLCRVFRVLLFSLWLTNKTRSNAGKYFDQLLWTDSLRSLSCQEKKMYLHWLKGFVIAWPCLMKTLCFWNIYKTSLAIVANHLVQIGYL